MQGERWVPSMQGPCASPPGSPRRAGTSRSAGLNKGHPPRGQSLPPLWHKPRNPEEHKANHISPQETAQRVTAWQRHRIHTHGRAAQNLQHSHKASTQHAAMKIKPLKFCVRVT